MQNDREHYRFDIKTIIHVSVLLSNRRAKDKMCAHVHICSHKNNQAMYLSFAKMCGSHLDLSGGMGSCGVSVSPSLHDAQACTLCYVMCYIYPTERIT